MTGQDACTLIAKWINETTDFKDITPEQIWNYSSTGELSLVFDLYWQAKAYYENATISIARDGTITLVPKDKDDDPSRFR